MALSYIKVDIDTRSLINGRHADSKEKIDTGTATTMTTEAEAKSENDKKSILRPWQKPAPTVVQHETGLKIMNSLTRQKESFIPQDGTRQVTWYMYVWPTLLLLH